jgi:hypothetical protein
MKRIGFDYLDPTLKPETSFHAPLLPQLVQGWGFFFAQNVGLLLGGLVARIQNAA